MSGNKELHNYGGASDRVFHSNGPSNQTLHELQYDVSLQSSQAFVLFSLFVAAMALINYDLSSSGVNCILIRFNSVWKLLVFFKKT